MTFPFYLLLIGVMYWVARNLFFFSNEKKSVLSSYASSAKAAEKKTLQERILTPLNSFSARYLTKQRADALTEQLQAAGWNITAEAFLRKKIMYPVVFSLVCIVGSILYGALTYNIGVIASWLLFFYPDYTLRRKVRWALQQRKLELPEYLIPLSQLLKTHTVLEAVQKAKGFAGPYLQPYVEKMVAEMEAFPGSHMPLRRFAEDVNLPEVHTFVMALQQSMRTDKAQSTAIIDAQIAVLRELKAENYKMLMETKPMEMNKYNVVILACMLVFPLVLVAMALIQGFQNV